MNEIIDGKKFSQALRDKVKNYVEVIKEKQSLWLYPTESWQTTPTTVSKIEIDSDYYINLKKL